MMTRRTILTLLAGTLAVGCGKNSEYAGNELFVLCAAGIRPAMEVIKTQYEEQHDCTVNVTYDGSGTLFGRLQAEVPADIYLPGDKLYIRMAQDKHMIDRYHTVAWFVPVIAVQKGNPKNIQGLSDLAQPELQVGLGKADACAIGNISRHLLHAADLTVQPDYEALTVNRLANQLKLKALDATIIWDATAYQYPNDIDIVPIPDADVHATALAIGVLKQAFKKKMARHFAAYAAGPVGEKAFRDHHYLVPGKTLRIACGASMRPPLEELARAFEKDTGCQILADYGGSGTVLLQLEQSKEGDIYICHDPFAYTCEQKKIATRWNTIGYIEPTLAVKKGHPKKVTGLKDLLREDLRLGLPHRDHSTRGQILWMIFEQHGMKDAMAKRTFFESRTHELVNQLKLDTVDVAVLWDAPTKAIPEFLAIPIEPEYKVHAITSATSGRTYPVDRVKVTAVELTFSREPLLAAQFSLFCRSNAGRAVLAKHHFALPGNQP